jgi:hypothetical protein
MLLEIVVRRSPETNRKSVVYRLQCDACGVVIEGSKGRYERGKTHCCNNKCVSKLRSEHPELFPDNGAARNTPEACAKAMATRKRRIEAGEIKHSWTGRKHSEETKRHLSEVSKGGIRSGKNNGMFGRTHSKEARERISNARSQLIIDGKFRAYGTCNKKGFHLSTKTGENCFFRSSWEEDLMKWLDTNPNVLTWEYEKIRLPYVYDDHKRWYVPDFLVTYTDSSRHMIEVKPKEFVEAQRVRLKREAGEKWCLENGATFITLTRQLMCEWGIYLWNETNSESTSKVVGGCRLCIKPSQ